MIEGKRVVLVDDSIVRGTTSQKIVQMVRDAGAKEVHMRIASPPTTSSCFYGVDTPEKSKLLASRMSVEEMARVHPRRFARLPVDRRALPRGRRGRPRQRRSRNSATPASPAQYPTRLLDHRRLGQCPHAVAAGDRRAVIAATADDPHDHDPDLTGRIALVTGASRGIGYFIAKHMAAAGAHVIAVARTVGGLEELDDEIKATRAKTGKGEATLVPLDLADMAGIDRLGGAIHERWGKLDILVANAGVLGVIAPIGHVEAKTFEKVMTINVTATWRLIRSVDPLLQAFRRRPGDRADLERGAFGARLLGALRGVQGGGRGAGPLLGRRDQEPAAARQRRRSRRHPHRDARAGDARREPGNAAAPFGDRQEHPAARQPFAHGNRRPVRRARTKMETILGYGLISCHKPRLGIVE